MAAAKKPRKRPAKKAAPKKTRTLCISHKEDADGISSAALIRQAFGGDTVLVDYPSQMEAIEEAADDLRLKSLYICDLGLSQKSQDQFVDAMARLRKRRVAVTYIDHHNLDPAIPKKLAKLKVKLIHDIGECTAVQVHAAFARKLKDHASFVAACAAITDYMEDRPEGRRLLEFYDRQFALVNATALTYNITGHQKDEDYLLMLVKELAAGRYPHDIPGAFEFAQEQAARLAETMAKVKKGLKRMPNLGHMEIKDSGAGGAVNFVLGLSGKDVGVAYKARTDRGIYAVSIRAKRSYKTHLGKIVDPLANELGGTGGGHAKACGAAIPTGKIKQFLRELNRRLN